MIFYNLGAGQPLLQLMPNNNSATAATPQSGTGNVPPTQPATTQLNSTQLPAVANPSSDSHVTPEVMSSPNRHIALRPLRPPTYSSLRR